MSRIGKQPVTIPDQVNVSVADRVVRVKGPKGENTVSVPAGITVATADQTIAVTRKNDEPQTRSLHGLVRALVANAVAGVSEGFSKRLELKGVGYRTEIQGKNVVLHVGFSHPVTITIPDGITAAVEKNTQILLTGINKQAVGQFAAKIRAVRPPEPYKGKGIRYADEHVKLKPGKQAAKTTA